MAGLRGLGLALAVVGGIWLRVSVSRWPHSGQGDPPLHGDFEAQRHWIEVTSSLAPADWYRNSTDNNMNHWGLDYPPLTAWHSWAMGRAARAIRPSIAKLWTSRGNERPGDRLFMRATVLAADAAVLLPALLLVAFALPRLSAASAALTTTRVIASGKGPRDTTGDAKDTTGDAKDTTRDAKDTTGGSKDTTGDAKDTTGGSKDTTGDAKDVDTSRVALDRWLSPGPGIWGLWSPVVWVFLACPPLLLIDHGHFQYNSISLGLVVASVGCMGMSVGAPDRKGILGAQRVSFGRHAVAVAWRLCAAAFFTAALNYKQMVLFLAPAVFAAHLAMAWRGARRARWGPAGFACEVALLAACVLAVTGVSWLSLCSKGAPATRLSGDERIALGLLLRGHTVLTRRLLRQWVGDRCLLVLRDATARVFPFSRGLYEDKVASLWCALEPLLRMRRRLISGQIRLATVLQLATGTTLVLILPAMASAIVAAGCCGAKAGLLAGAPTPTPSPPLLLCVSGGQPHPPSGRTPGTSPPSPWRWRWMLWLCLLLACSGTGFFLAAFQVHEKSILLPLLPLALAAAIAAATGDSDDIEHGSEDEPPIKPPLDPSPTALVHAPAPSAASATARRLYQWGIWPITAGMVPLLLRDRLGIPTAAATAIALLVLSDAVQSAARPALVRPAVEPRKLAPWQQLQQTAQAHIPWWVGAWSLLEPRSYASWAATPLLQWTSAIHCALVGPLVWISHAGVLFAWATIEPHPRYPYLYPQLLAAVHAVALLWVLFVATLATWQAAAECAATDARQEHKSPVLTHRPSREPDRPPQEARPKQVGPPLANKKRSQRELRPSHTA